MEAPFLPLSPRAFFGVSFLVPYCPLGQACYPAVIINDLSLARTR